VLNQNGTENIVTKHEIWLAKSEAGNIL